MAQARRRSSTRRGPKRGWVLLLVGIGIGVVGVMLTQMWTHRTEGRSGLANLFSSFNKPAEKPKKEPEAAKPPKPKFDFYTILPETETVLPERHALKNKPPKSKSEEGVSYILQAGSFAGYEEADQLKAKLALAGLVAQIQKITIEGKGEYHRVRLGPYENIDKLDAAAVQLQKLGVKAIRLKVKKGET
ncbi:MAG: SPOR domain-containing protein [Gammaproteobacteria bacterium]|nr:SPOR domain-containing protein [Gammaproteobacteria bacterium]